MAPGDFERESEAFAQQHEHTSSNQRTAYITIITEASKNRIELIRDYTVIATTTLAGVLTLLTAGKELVNNTTLMLFSGLMMFAVIVLCVISRQYYIDEVDELLAQTEKLHASILLQATKIRYAKDFEDRQRVLEEREAMKPPVYAKKPNFFRSDIRNIGYVLLVGFIAAICALI